jgi:uncharacterized protein YbjT (DUF2867 family)
MPTSGMTVEQLIEPYVDDRSPSWAPGAAEETRKRVAQHIVPHVGSIAIERLRPVDVQQLHSQLRAAGLSEGSIGRVHDILRAALNWASAWTSSLGTRQPRSSGLVARSQTPTPRRRRRSPHDH